MSVLNIAGYQFVEVVGLDQLRPELLTLCQNEGLRGTILLSPEGVNVFAAGSRPAIDVLLSRLRQIPGLNQFEVKESFSREQPFRRMKVKIKREIIAFGVDGISPEKYTSRRIGPRDLKQWLDEGRPFLLLDTRNNEEIQAGTFEGAVSLGIDDFRKFPAALVRLPEGMKHQPIVTFCTGGIRCEKAAPLLEREGFQDVYQLDGGILKYFEECGGAHYRGNCFVFDERMAVDPSLQEQPSP